MPVHSLKTKMVGSEILQMILIKKDKDSTFEVRIQIADFENFQDHDILYYDTFPDEESIPMDIIMETFEGIKDPTDISKVSLLNKILKGD